jgi:hypothetical protein
MGGDMFPRVIHRLGIALFLVCCGAARAATYYVDFEAGSDSNPGTSPDQAFRHCPGDSQAADAAKNTRLQPGDVVRFKGGVVYRGQIDLRHFGAKGNHIVYDGNTRGDYGVGRAIIDGSMPLAGLKRCRGADEAGGNPAYRDIFYGYLPKGSYWNSVALCQDDDILPVAQDPNSPDPVFQEDPKHYVKTYPDIPQTAASLKVRFLGNITETPNRPLLSMLDDSRNSAVIERINSGAEVEIELPKLVTVVELSMTPQPGYTNPKDVSFHVGGNEILKATLEFSATGLVEQKFKLDGPVTFKKLVVKFHTAHPLEDGRMRNWGAVQQIAAYDRDGKNVLFTDRKSTLVNKEYFTQADPQYWEGAYLALYARPAMVYYKRVLGYYPDEHKVWFETLRHSEIPYERTGAFSMMNSVRIIDKPGEYSVNPDPEEDGTHKLFVWPLRLIDGKADGLTYASYPAGFSARNASYVTIQGFLIRKQGGSRGSQGITAYGPATDMIIRDVKVTRLRGRGSGIHTYAVDNVLVEDCEISENAGHTKGILLRNGRNVIARGCLLRRNSSTALDYYTVHNGVVQDCTLLDNKGMHANGLTFYVGCQDILVEGNTVARGNAALTVQDGENMIIRNNTLSGRPAIAMWSGGAYNSIVITNNHLIFEGDRGGSFAAIYGGNRAARGYTIANNIVDGLSGNVLRKAEVHHNVFTMIGPVQKENRLGDNKYVPNLETLFVAPGKEDYRPRQGSPAVDAGVALGTINKRDADGMRRDLYGKVDIGPCEFTGSALSKAGKYPRNLDESSAAFRSLKNEVQSSLKAGRLGDALAAIQKVFDLSPNSRFAEESLRKCFVRLSNDQQQGVYEFFRRRIAEHAESDPLKAEEYDAMFTRLDCHARPFTLGGYKIGPPEVVSLQGYDSVLEHLPGGKTYVIRGMDFSAEHGGNVKANKGHGSIYMWNDKGHWLEWTIEDADEGFYELVLMHASENNSVRQYLLNGEPIKGLEEVELNATGGWLIWEKTALAVAIPLRAGRNVLRVVNVEDPLNFKELKFVQVVSDKPVKTHFVSDAAE